MSPVWAQALPAPVTTCPSTVRPHWPSRRVWDTPHSLSTRPPVPLSWAFPPTLIQDLLLLYLWDFPQKSPAQRGPPGLQFLSQPLCLLTPSLISISFQHLAS